MSDNLSLFVSIWIKFFFVFTPFFALSMFLSITDGYTENRRRRLAVAVSGAVTVICLVLFFVGNQLFALFGITLDSFRIGAGALLFLSAVGLVQDKAVAPTDPDRGGDVAVVPLAIPIIVGPATTGILLVLGAGLKDWPEKVAGFAGLIAAIVSLGLLLVLGSLIQRSLGSRGIAIVSKLNGLVVAALAAQMIMTGVLGFLSH